MTAVVTGLGVAAPTGLGIDDFWAAALTGRSGIGRISRFDPSSYPATLAGEVPGFVPEEHLSSRLIPQTDHMTRLALAAADWALRDAEADPSALPGYEMGVVTASSSGGFEFGQREMEKLWSKGREYVSAYQSWAWFYAVNTGQISIRHGMRGPSGVVVSEQAGGIDALAQARRQIRKGLGLVVSGGMDSSLCPWGWVAQLSSGRLSTASDPDRAYLPFDEEASGHVPGEGGAILIVEDDRAARARGRDTSYGELAGFASAFDPKPGSGREPALRRTIESALADASVAPEQVDAVFADAAGVPELDLAEATAIASVFGARRVPVTAPKTLTGRLYSGGAPLDVVSALLAIRDGVIPPTFNVVPARRYPIDLVSGQPRETPIRTALVLARGHGGFNTAVVLRATG
ncbi:ketosynthase chain-length factor [Amycolatopsis sp. NPDC059090]|uniref:ketosynthase chain-length factor n=1 Tax=unclassified Amycolatopsis TaxID=2618356 RepID=UPI00366D259F